MTDDSLNNYGSPKATQKNEAMSGTQYIPNTTGSDPDLNRKVGNSQDGNPNTPDIPVTGTNLDPYLAIGASVLMVGGGYFVAKGQLTQSALATIVSAVLSLAGTAYVAYKGTVKSKVNSLASNLDVPKAALKRHIVALKRPDGTWQA